MTEDKIKRTDFGLGKALIHEGGNLGDKIREKKSAQRILDKIRSKIRTTNLELEKSNNWGAKSGGKCGQRLWNSEIQIPGKNKIRGKQNLDNGFGTRESPNIHYQFDRFTYQVVEYFSLQNFFHSRLQQI